LCAVPLVLAIASDHTLDVAALAIALGFALGTYGHVIHSRALVLAAIALIGVICLVFVITGEAQTFN
jgi:predicted ABC-type exoprotein transport system permease subunit